ncbi:capsular polysaccharide biosynthesis protein [Albidovulum sp.]|uniref:capsular polysaccharide biosynthesis protein n=1 Tax=Albidovulum sp. TaxID=1872424 RepID=UPI001DDD9780|nr:capsular polysaccharide biosynthesis protein [Paracoccaceae bacterium]MCC0046526.1 capsular polysaccharide biosynthesis protein [Defluviimonas sp.]MCP5376212.1 capsular polysaccharide biosynthesis protein [Paracoccaceae bacterium]
MSGAGPDRTGGAESRPLYVFNGGFLSNARVRRILTLSGYALRLGLPGKDDTIAVWGKSPTAPRGEAVAARTGAAVLRVEDAFLRSIRPGRSGEPPMGLLIDPHGIHFDGSTPSLIEEIIRRDPLDDGAVLSRARDGIARLKQLHLSKYNAFDPGLEVPAPGYVLVVDQTRNDASIRHGGASAGTFREMLLIAQEEHPGARIVIKTHPEAAAGHRQGHYTEGHAHGRISVLRDPVSPWELLEGAIAVYTVSSQLGFEAILAGHKPRVFGQPFYAGWGLTQDENPVARRQKRLTRAQLFAAAMILAPTWYDPARDRLTTFEGAVDQLEAQVRAFRDDRRGHVAVGMRLWKRAHLQRAFGRERRLAFADDPGKAAARAHRDGRDILVWAGKESETLRQAAGATPIRRVEDGFLRSRGLGAELVPPLALVADRAGIYYDPSRPSDLERLIAAGPPPGGEARAERLLRRLTETGLSKYNLAASVLPDLPKGRRILVPGQVEDDASVRLGAGTEHTNLALLERVRAENPDAVILYKPHPDVEAGLRPGHLPEAEVLRLADRILTGADPVRLIDAADEVWTITSGLGFEALIRGKAVVTLGMPFYAGWGLTEDLFAQPERRGRASLAALVHAALIAYPRYVDPVSGLPCPVEVIVDRLAAGDMPSPGPANRILSKLQGVLAGQSWLWRSRGGR